jgi:hypothetical protein
MIFSDTTDRDGIVELLEDLTATQSASGGSYPLKVKTRDINNALDDYFVMAISASGTWQVDDTNHTKYPIMTTNLVSSQQDYSFTVDEQSNQVLDIYRVECKDSNGNWQLLKAYDENEEETALSEQATETGTPTRYSKTANGIFLDKIPSYNSTNGLKIYFARTGSYFVSTDTTKEPGIPNVFHRYLAWKPAYWYWLPKDSQRASIYKAEVLDIEKAIKEYYSKRTRDEKPRLSVKRENTR